MLAYMEIIPFAEVYIQAVCFLFLGLPPQDGKFAEVFRLFRRHAMTRLVFAENIWYTMDVEYGKNAADELYFD